jgi:hypothetical protein
MTTTPTNTPIDYKADNGHGKPTHLCTKSGKWIATPKGYRTREDGLPSHVYARIDGTREWVKVPSTEELEAWVSDSVCETPDGDIVEPDHPHSWLSILGLI